MKKLFFALATGSMVASCSPKPIITKPNPLVEYRQNLDAQKPESKLKKSISAKQDGFTCTAMQDRITYSFEREGKTETKVKNFGVPLIANEPGELFLELLLNKEFTAILTNKTLVFTVGWRQVFEDKNPSILNQVVDDFSIKGYDVESLVKKGILGWTGNELKEGFILGKDGMLTVVGANGGRARLEYDLANPLTEKTSMKYFEGDVYLAHPNVSVILIVKNASTSPSFDILRLKKQMGKNPELKESREGLILIDGSEKELIRKKE